MRRGERLAGRWQAVALPPTTERVLAQLIVRTAGRSDRTLHVQRHVAQPIGLPAWEVAASVAQLRAAGVVETDPQFPALIRLVPAQALG